MSIQPPWILVSFSIQRIRGRKVVMAVLAAHLEHADQMMVSVRASKAGFEVTFADGLSGRVPFAEVPEVASLDEIAGVTLSNAFEVVVVNRRGETIELPRDFMRHYCDPSYKQRVEAVAAKGRAAIGARIRSLRKAAGLTQEKLAAAAGVGRVTTARIESGEQSPRYKTLLALAAALGVESSDLLVHAAA